MTMPVESDGDMGSTHFEIVADTRDDQEKDGKRYDSQNLRPPSVHMYQRSGIRGQDLEASKLLLFRKILPANNW